MQLEIFISPRREASSKIATLPAIVDVSTASIFIAMEV
jgi:hypothetical protein